MLTKNDLDAVNATGSIPRGGDTLEMLEARRQIFGAPVTPSTTLTEVTGTTTDAVAAGTVAAGASSITIVNVGTATVAANGVQLAPGQPAITLVAPAGGKLPAISHSASATGILRITRIGSIS